MCGICGFAHNRNIKNDVLYSMNQAMKHRGPDDEGYYFNITRNGAKIGLAQKRLSIIDLSSKGHQPMATADGNIVITYNGEIYNFNIIKEELIGLGYEFVSTTDTEVILYAYTQWGIDCVKKFNGMFAFAIYDKRTDVLFLVRDRMGVKPLYYYYNGNDIVFASELKPIIKYPYFSKEINLRALNGYLATQYIAGAESIFNHVYRLLPGHILKWKNGQITDCEYWSVETVLSSGETYEGDYESGKKKLEGMLLDSVSLRMISDVPLGAFLSNGIDSTLTVALMKEVSTSKVKTFTIGFCENEYNEADKAAEVAKYLDTEHHETYLSINDAKKYIDKIPFYCDEPMADPSIIPTMLVSEIAKKEVTVALSGDAGDELFFGYNHYINNYKLMRYRKLSKALNTLDRIVPFRKVAALINSHRLCKLFNLYDDEHILNADAYTHWDRYADLCGGEIDLKRFLIADNICASIEERAMIRDIMTYLPDDILTKVDRASMSVSLESRAPFLDYRIVEMALRFPIEFKYYNGIQKRMLKDILFARVPEEMIGKNKRGFGIPYAEWLREDFANITHGMLEESYIKRQEIFNWKVLKKIIHGFENKSDKSFAKLLWTVFIFQLWYEQTIMN